MTLKTNDRILIDGREGKITLIHAAGKYMRYELDDGRAFFDLDKLLKSGSDRIRVTTPSEAAPETFKMEYDAEFREDVDDEDSEEEAADIDN